MATTKLTAPWNLGYLDGYNGARPGDQRADWDAEQRRAYLNGYQEGADYRAKVERDGRDAVQRRIRDNEHAARAHAHGKLAPLDNRPAVREQIPLKPWPA